MPNNFPGKCETCSCHVAARAGQAVKTALGWRVRCSDHGVGAVAPAPAAQVVSIASALTRSIRVTRDGRRSYIEGDTLSVRGVLRAGGCHWDADRKAWWIGSHETALELAERARTGPAEAAPAKRIERCVQCGCSLDRYQVQHGFKFCSSDCAIERKMGSGWSGRTASGGWHQGSDD